MLSESTYFDSCRRCNDRSTLLFRQTKDDTPTMIIKDMTTEITLNSTDKSGHRSTVRTQHSTLTLAMYLGPFLCKKQRSGQTLKKNLKNSNQKIIVSLKYLQLWMYLSGKSTMSPATGHDYLIDTT